MTSLWLPSSLRLWTSVRGLPTLIHGVKALMSTSVLIAILLVVFIGALSRSTLGFGDAVLSMPLLALLPIPLGLAVALMGLVGVSVALIVVIVGWRDIDWDPLKPILFAVILGVPLGLVILSRVSPRIVTGVLGLVLMAYGLYSLIKNLGGWGDELPRLTGRWWPYLFGLVAGALGSAYNFNGIPVAVYGTFRKWPPARFRNTMQGYFLVSGSLVVAGQGLGGLWSARLWMLYLWCVPAMVGAVIVGTLLHRRIPIATFQNAVLGFIVMLGLLLVMKSVFFVTL